MQHFLEVAERELPRCILQGKQIRDSKETPIFSKLHKEKAGTPTMGCILIWATVLIFAVVFYLLKNFTGIEFFQNLNFLTRAQTLLSLGALIACALIGLVDDYMNVRKIGPHGAGALDKKCHCGRL